MFNFYYLFFKPHFCTFMFIRMEGRSILLADVMPQSLIQDLLSIMFKDDIQDHIELIYSLSFSYRD